MARRTKAQILAEKAQAAEAELALAVVDIQREAVRKVGEDLSRIQEAEWDDDQPHRSVRSRPTNPHARPAVRHYTSIHDSRDGRYVPFYENQADVLSNLAAARNLISYDSVAIGAVQSQQSYVLTGDWTANVTVDGKDAKTSHLAAGIQRYVDKCIDRWDLWSSTLDNAFASGMTDGEVFLALYPDVGGNVILDICLPEQVREPSGKNALNEWLGEPSTSAWWFGVHTRLADHNARLDWARPLGYHVVNDDAGRDWDYLPSWPQPQIIEDSRCCYHWKWNAPTHAARGVSDFFPILDMLERVYKLSRNTGDGAAIQAAIAMVVQRASSTRAATLNDVAGNAIDSVIRSRTTGGAMSTYTRKFPAGTVVETDKESTYHPGPMGDSGASNYIDVGQFLLRSRIATRWNSPEYMISGDASNGNYASSLVAESPFVKFCERRQKNVRNAVSHLLWRALRMRHLAGMMHELSSDWRQFEARVDVDIVAGEVATRDPMITTQKNQILHGAGVLSAKRWAQEEGLPEEEVAQQQPPTGMQESFNEEDHPRDDDGKFVSKGELDGAAKDPSKLATLLKRVTDPKEREKLKADLKGRRQKQADGKKKAASTRAEKAKAKVAAAQKALDDAVAHNDAIKSKAAGHQKNISDLEKKLADIKAKQKALGDADRSKPAGSKAQANAEPKSKGNSRVHREYTPEEAENELSASASQWSDGNDYFANKGVKQYAGTADSFKINQGLRTGKMDSRTEEYVSNLTKQIDRASFPVDIITHRAITATNSKERDAVLSFFQERVGKTFTDKAFVSTTANAEYAKSWGKKSEGKPLMCRVLVPKGAKAAYLPKSIVGKQEWEVLIQRGSKFRVHKADEDGIEVELI